MKRILFLSSILIFLSFTSIAQNLALTFDNAAITNDGVNDYYEADVMIMRTSASDFKLGTGQFYIDYNPAAFGGSISDTTVDFEYSVGSILSETNILPIYGDPVINSNTNSTFSIAWHQALSAGSMATDNVTDTPTLLGHLKIQMINETELPNICFNVSGPAFDDQFFTACGPFTLGLNLVDCTGSSAGTQILDYDGSNCSGSDISCNETATFIGGDWDISPLIPDLYTSVIIAEDYFTSVIGANIEACNITVNSGAILKIGAGDYLKVKNDITVNGTLIVEHEGSVVQIDDSAIVTNNGSINVEKITPSLNDRGFSVMGSPMSSETREDVYSAAAIVRHHLTNNFNPHPQVTIDDPGAENFADDNGDNWQTHTGGLTVGEGYLVKPYFIGDPDSPFTTNYTQGTLNNGVVNFTAIFGDDQNDSPNILSNPYASSIDADVFITDNAIVDAIYYWEHINIPNASYPGYNPSNYDMGDISMYNLSGGVAAVNAGGGAQDSNQFIPSGQGFGIKANAAGTITFNNVMRLTDNNDNYRNSENVDRLYLSISNETYNLKSATLIAFTEFGTNGYDRNYDVKRLATPVSIYSLNNDRELGIQGRVAFNEDHIIPLGFSTQVDENQEYTISISSLEGEQLIQATVYLKDNLLNTITNLSETDYTYTANEGHQTNRFLIVFSMEILSNNEVIENSVTIFPNPTKNILHINSPIAAITNIDVFDLRGRKINSLHLDNKTSYQLDMTLLTSAVYFVEIQTEKATITKRIIKE